ncbi:hypothetical protein HMPREF2867_10065 [Streptococcus sp. HMSC064H09]|jgi:hypothetical protein|uniref:hypothetical protein n=1 Tax=Streptococcus sp. HMSC064H09 TaxID=1739371 RepID=UPI0008A11500|nr:hypothetical protein [Streptococcus sp. HMSC064H09]OFR76617.1 hypothetical protein HMPREF2867_10065 [Streptococcus sp. HMSC064H09]DAP14434.1 MAG TPA: hypothetical protein [Caudoviricetes sp.]
MSKLHDFAQAVGADIKEIKTTLAGKADKGSEGVTEERLTQAITQAKTDLIGGAPEELDTLKELADKIAAGGGNVDSGIITKLTEFGNRITAIETEDLVAAYAAAKA